MGFPDFDENLTEGDSPRSNLFGFRSWIGGKRVQTKLLVNDVQHLYHVKTIRFAPGESILVVDRYRTPYAIANAGYGEGYYRSAHYTITTGGTWRGPIGRVTLVVKFEPDAMPRPVRWEQAYFNPSAPPGGDSNYENYVRMAFQRANTIGRYSGLPCVRATKDKLVFYAERLLPDEDFDLTYVEPMDPDHRDDWREHIKHGK